MLNASFSHFPGTNWREVGGVGRVMNCDSDCPQEASFRPRRKTEQVQEEEANIADN